MRQLNFALLFVLAGAAAGPAMAQTAPADEAQVTTAARTALGVTIYNDSQALIRDTRNLNLRIGVNRIAIRDVAATPSSSHHEVPQG